MLFLLEKVQIGKFGISNVRVDVDDAISETSTFLFLFIYMQISLSYLNSSHMKVSVVNETVTRIIVGSQLPKISRAKSQNARGY